MITIALLAGFWSAWLPVAQARLLWKPKPTDGDVGDWSALQSAAPPGKAWSPSRLNAGLSPVPHDQEIAIRVRLNAGDVAYNPRHDPPIDLGNRSEMVHLPYLHEGDERWYHWRVYFPDNFAVTDGKDGGAVFTQWHHWSQSGEPGSPPLLFVARTNDIQVVGVPSLESEDAETLADVPQKKGQWRDFVFHVRFSSDPSKALTELWIDHKRVELTQRPTLFPGYDDYLKMGLYRRPTAQEDNVVYFEDISEGTERSDVEPLPKS